MERHRKPDNYADAGKAQHHRDVHESNCGLPAEERECRSELPRLWAGFAAAAGLSLHLSFHQFNHPGIGYLADAQEAMGLEIEIRDYEAAQFVPRGGEPVFGTVGRCLCRF